MADTRMSAWFAPPRTCGYTFLLRSKHGAELWWSGGETAERAERLASDASGGLEWPSALRTGVPDARVSRKLSLQEGGLYWLDVQCVGGGGCALGVRVHGSLVAHPLAASLRQFALPGAPTVRTTTHPTATVESQTVTLRKEPTQREVRRVELYNVDYAYGAEFKLAIPSMRHAHGQEPWDHSAPWVEVVPFDEPFVDAFSYEWDHEDDTDDARPCYNKTRPCVALMERQPQKHLSGTFSVHDSAATFRSKLQPLLDAQEGVRCKRLRPLASHMVRAPSEPSQSHAPSRARTASRMWPTSTPSKSPPSRVLLCSR